MAENHTPESWIGRDVMVARAGAVEAELARLDGINDWGLVCTYKHAEVDEPVMLPWGSVSWVRVAVQQEVEALNGDTQDSGS